MDEDQAVRIIREIWKKARTLEPRPGWPAGGPTLPKRLADNMSHFKSKGVVVYRVEPYGPITSEEIKMLANLPSEWAFSLNARHSTHHPGSTIQILFWRRR